MHNFIKQTLLYIKAHMEFNTVIVCVFNTPLASIDTSFKQTNKDNKETAQLNCTIDQMSSTDICRTFHPTPVAYIHSS
jgi:hypothetical protein